MVCVSVLAPDRDPTAIAAQLSVVGRKWMCRALTDFYLWVKHFQCNKLFIKI